MSEKLNPPVDNPEWSEEQNREYDRIDNSGHPDTAANIRQELGVEGIDFEYGHRLISKPNSQPKARFKPSRSGLGWRGRLTADKDLPEHIKRQVRGEE